MTRKAATKAETYAFRVVRMDKWRFMIMLEQPGSLAEDHFDFLEALVKTYGPAPTSVRIRGDTPMEHLSLDDKKALRWWSNNVSQNVIEPTTGGTGGLFKLVLMK